MSFDLLFKKMFGDENHIERTAYLISTILNIPYNDVKNNITILPNNKKLINKKDKRQESDVVTRVILSVNQKVNLEMNVVFDESRQKRNLMYITFMYGNQLKNKEDYTKVEKCVQINFNLDYINKDKKEIIERYSLKDKYNYEWIDLLEIYHVNIAECSNIWYNKSEKSINEYNKEEQEIIKIGAFLVEKDYIHLKEILDETEMGEKVKEGILESMEEYSEDEDMSIFYDAEKDRIAQFNGSISAAKREGMKQGIEQGIEQGSLNKSKEIAKSMKEENIGIEIISKCTGLTKEEINNL